MGRRATTTAEEMIEESKAPVATAPRKRRPTMDAVERALKVQQDILDEIGKNDARNAELRAMLARIKGEGTEPATTEGGQ